MGVKPGQGGQGGGSKCTFLVLSAKMASRKPLQSKFLEKCDKSAWRPPPTLKIGVSSTRNHRFHERHQTFKSSELDCKNVFLNTCWHLKCRLGIEDRKGHFLGGRGGRRGGGEVVCAKIVQKLPNRVQLAPVKRVNRGVKWGVKGGVKVHFFVL